ncbi:TIGR00282 family metallophosphoesterase [Varunaivibrio sulfuroxidans]|uniref:Capsule synthesis protein CapA domain-containing protein n=1 Tax=Varunaivibrio sulfuroxidans TaxID=1773489 RepID=A0A4R3JDB3_9PROT|nr:TIGR00282 family metallophosphoesterase [Varunaivibrio sulfuroxidans]TCS63143.1 hypothetical protein EDD55_104237 [Varunaivibrio sulfuroxidans]WES31790.1 TIGR00282 family metallophosphoesterase [Varunaivibrio sulfuroxidans]
MKILYCGDVVGQSGRRAVIDHVPTLRRELDLDFVIVNAENAAHGFGLTGKICQGFYDIGVDAITTGNHVWDQREIIDYIARDPRLLRPLNYPEGTPGRGWNIYDVAGGAKIMVAQVMGRLFMDPLDDPFAGVDIALLNKRLGHGVAAIIVDIHCEATSEKMSMGHYLDGRVSAVIGTHSHVPTADAQILPGGTAYQTDAGMCGDYDSVIGMVKDGAISRFLKKIPSARLQPALGEATLCAVYIETDDASGLARVVAPLRRGGRLASCTPQGG